MLTLGGAKGRGLRRMFWELAPGDVIGKPVNTQCPKVINAWKRRKYKMEKASRRPWIQDRAMQLREYTQKEFREIFVDDRPFGTDSINREANVQSKAVLSNAMTLMDKIRGWEDEESWVGSKFAACMWIYTQEALTGGQILDRVQEEYLRKRTMSTNWVCAGAFVDNGWVSSRKIFQQEEENLSMAMDFKIDVLGVVQWSLLLFSAPTDLNRILGTELKIYKSTTKSSMVLSWTLL